MAETHIVCTTDFRPQSERSFRHALALAMAEQARLTLLHIGAESREQVPWQRFPSVRDTLIKWRRLEPRQPREAVAKLVEVRKKAMRDEEPAHGIFDFLGEHRVDLLVMIAHQRTGWGPFRRTPTALRVLRAAATDLLLLPDDGPDLIDLDNGRFHLRRILLPVSGDRDIRAAVSMIGSLGPKIADGRLSVTLLQIGESRHRADHALPPDLDIEWQLVERQGKLVDVILTEANRIDADLIVMTTARRSRLLDRVRNARVEQVLHQVRRPLLTVASD